MIHLDRQSKNLLRCFPLVKGSTLDTSAIVDLRILHSFTGHTDFYIKSIYADNYSVNIILWVRLSNNSDVFFCSFSGAITKSFQTLYSADSTYSASLTIGERKFWQNQNLIFAVMEQKLEACSHARLPALSIKSITVDVTGDENYIGKLVSVSGDVAFRASNLTHQPIATGVFNYSVTNQNQMLPGVAPSLASGTCNFKSITSISGVTPDVNGNITIGVVAPLTITIANPTTVASSTLTKTSVCGTQPSKAPLVENNAYYSDLDSTVIPEWKTWS